MTYVENEPSSECPPSYPQAKEIYSTKKSLVGIQIFFFHIIAGQINFGHRRKRKIHLTTDHDVNM